MHVMICDDHPVCQIGIELLLKRLMGEGLEVKHLSTGLQLLEATSERVPDLVFLDLGLPDISGTHIARQLRQKFPKLKIIVMTGLQDPTALNLVLNSGVYALISKSCSAENLSGILAKMTQTAAQQPYTDSVVDEILKSLNTEDLTPREWEVLTLIAQGQTNRDIATALNCSVDTVKTHRSNLGQKVYARNRAELTAWYLHRKKHADFSPLGRG